MRWIVAGVAAVVAIGVTGTIMLTSGSTPTPTAGDQTVERASSGEVTAKGTVQPITTQNLSFSVSGTVSSVSVKAGDSVTKGQELARIDQADAKEAVATAEDELADAKAALSAVQASASASPSACATSSAARPSTSGTSGSASYSSSSSGTGGSGGGAAACGNTGKTQNFISSILSAKQSVNTKTAALAKAERELAGTVITAPVAGKVLTVSIKVGDTAKSNVISIGVVSTMVVKASFSEADVVALTMGQSATVALPGHDGEYTAKITEIAQTGVTSSNLVTYSVVLTFDKVPDGILIGQSANVTVSAA
ncbi:MAG: HlyD family efflux transporter periplasmic adaptor subunit [Hamadaea sp.]|uniref:efflux RND transporter periplasmic adaptor subunit n=1 Tax=Hamadaea sp. TaxID=2024425 RepID=UPI001858218C|nr:HlyD family efflux transporter periplasmic adaptor subunit [Hamadaea sp.]NUR72242.1 HlyD family efflux transporter periplasmic adaptor subunit [Hamadaea sp.]NUT17673.1 HlyD family efflux transporter periplasmic adaptor subunit [Hamadaea sp.]